MIEFANDEDRLRYQLLSQPRRFDYRWTHAADCELRQILFRSLAAQKDGNLSYFFPQGLPADQSEPWSLRAAQGAVDGAEYLPSAKGTACGHIFKSGESTYSCKTCQADDTCVLCSRCFECSDHEGHQVYISVSPGNSGCCDCGDKEAWKKEVTCSIHTDTGEEEVKPSGKDKAPENSHNSQVPSEIVDAVRTTVASAVDYLCDVFSCAPEQLRLPKTEDSITRDEKLSRLSSPTYGSDGDDDLPVEYAVMLWNDEKHTVNDVQNQVAMACKRTKTYGLQKAYEVNDNGRAIVHYTTDVSETVKMAAILERIKITVTVRSSRDTFREQMCETIIDWMSDIGGCAVGDDPYLLRNVVCEELLKPWRLGSTGINKEIGLEGIDDHEFEDTEKMRRRYATLFRPTMAANIVRVQMNTNQDDDDDDEDDDDDFDEEEEIVLNEDEAEEMEMEIDQNAALDGDIDMDFTEEGIDDTEAMEAALAGYPPPPPPPPPGHRNRVMTPAESDDGAEEQTRPVVDAPHKHIPQTPVEKVTPKGPLRPSKHWLEKPEGYRAPRPTEPAEDLWQRVRLDWLVLYDLRLWKTLRIKLRHLYITNVATIPHFKRILGLRFAGLYTPLAELYLVADREPDHSIINLSVQMLTTPSITEEVVERGNFLTNLMAILYTFLTTRQVGYPEDAQPKATLAFDAGSVTNRRMFHFFVDMRWLFQSEFIHHKMRTEPRYLLQFLDLVKLHQGICPNVRAVGDHVEYESDAWISASLIIKEIDRLSKAVASSFESASPEIDSHLQRAIRTTAQVTMINAFGYERKRFHAHEIKDDMAWHTVGPFEPDGKTYSVPKFVVMSEPMSFHHPLHYLLSWLLENGKSMSRNEMRSLLHFTPEDLKDPYNITRGAAAPQTLTSDELLSGVFDHPLRLCAWLSQMKANMWVRNGITLRHQAHTYRSVSHRDISYQRDIFMLQAGLVLCGADDEKPGERFLAQMIDRFQMTQWMKGEFTPVEGYEESQQIDVLEDFYHLLVVALCERGNLAVPAKGEDQFDKILQHDIAHALCFKPLSFSDLNTRVTEKIADSDSFQRVLEDMTVFRAPEGMSDTGTFELKPEFIEIVDPYYAHYSRNHREEAENVHKKHMARKTGKKPEDVVFEPYLQSLEGSLFKDLSAVTKTRLFASIIAAALQFGISAKDVASKIQATRVETFLHMILHLSLIAVIEDGDGEEGFVELAASMTHKLHPGTPWTIVSMLIVLSEMPEYQSCQPAIKHLLQRMQQKQPERLSTAMGPLATQLDRSDNDSPASLSAEDKEKKKQEAKARQARVMAQMKQQQNSFLMNKGLSGYEDEEFDDLENEMSFNQEPESLVEQRKEWNFPTGTCILCQEACDDRKLYGTFAFLGESNILRSTPVDDPDFVEEVIETPESLDQSADEIRPFGVAGKNKHTVQKTTGDGKIAKIERQGLSKGFPHAQHSTCGPVSSSCGHIMHYGCFELYLTATQRRHQTQIARSQPETIALKEFICPLCKALGNTFLPIIWKAKQCAHEHELHAAKSFEDWLSEGATTYAPDLSWLQNANSLPYLQQQGQEIYANRSSEYVDSNFGPVLAAALRESRASDQSSDDTPRYSLRRGLSLSSWFRTDRPEPTQDGTNSTPGTIHSGGETVSPAAELLKAYNRIDETIRINKLGLSMDADDSKSNPVSPLSRALGFTISALEIQARGTTANPMSASLLGDLSEQTMTHLRIISETIESYLSVNILRSPHANSVAREIALKRDIMSAQLFGVESDYTMIDLRDVTRKLLVEDDIFLFFADWIAFFAPSVAEAPNILQLCLWAEIVKVIHVYKNLVKDDGVRIPDGVLNGLAAPTNDFAATVNGLAAKDKHDSQAQKPFSEAQLKTLRLLLEKYAQAFLRKCIVLMHVRYGLDFECPYDLDSEAPELSRLTKLLHIPSMDALFGMFASSTHAGAQLHTLSHRWISQVNTASEQRQNLPVSIKLPHPTIYELVGLPKNYDTLTEEAIKRKCPTTGKEITDPAVCLFCAAIFCSQATCCMKGPDHSQRGGCWQHMQKCGGRVGIFINIRKCMVLFLHEPMSGSFAHAPYLDRHGEPDPTLRRHHQLFLNQKRYDKLMREVWLGHGIQTFISRKLEADINPGGWETL